jgi:hypothetical protein
MQCHGGIIGGDPESVGSLRSLSSLSWLIFVTKVQFLLYWVVLRKNLS